MTQRARRKEKGLESDECYYLANEPLIRHKKNLDFSVDPPPDLAVEVEVSRTAVGRLPVYASLGIPEVWRCDDDEQFTFLKLTERGQYAEIERSITFPFLEAHDLDQFLELRLEVGDRESMRKFVRWVRRKIKS
jgi:Uma2 family endonuclease